MHVHIATTDGTAKFWIEPIISLADFYNVSSQDLKKIQALIEKHINEISSHWKNHFNV
ncbi:MAG TPA: hypothetical protein DEH02_01850 [Bacteroidales bacterium]|nr:hypothetical protein [Bacteroidales bacterium]